MPFTFAHPLAVIPLRKNRYFDFSALVVGSMSPDFEYFIHFRPYQVYGHSIVGQVLYNLPLVFVVLLVWHYVLKKQVIINLPKPYCTGYSNLLEKKWKINSIKSLVVLIYSALIGMLSHLLWDSFTHVDGFCVTRIAFLSQNINLINYKIPIYKILQHGSTVIGLTIIILYLLRNKECPSKKGIIKVSKISKFKFWTGILIIDIIMAGIVIILNKDFTIGRIVVSFISGGFIAAIIISLLTKRMQEYA